MPNYVPISTELHRHKHWGHRTSLDFAKSDTVAPLFVSELASAAQAMPIAFIKQGQGFALVVVMGLKPAQNLFISTEGAWLSEYMPVSYRSSPFQLLAVAGKDDEQIFCIDEECIVEGPQGTPFFNDDGSITEALSSSFEMVKAFNATRQQTQNICNVLAAHDVIQPWELELDNGREKQTVEGLYKVDEAIFNSLADAAFLELRQVGALPLVFSQLLSLQKISVLAKLVRQTEAETVEPVKSDTFSFAGL